MRNDGSQFWVVISRGMNKYVMEMPEGNEEIPNGVEAKATNSTPVQHQASSSSVRATLPKGQRHWITIPVANRADWDHDSTACWLPKTVCRILRHKVQLREADGAVEWEKLCLESCRAEPTMDISDWTTDEWIEHLARGSTRQRFQYCLDCTGTFKVTLEDKKVDPTLHDNVILPNNFVKFIYHAGCSHDLHSIIQSGLIAGGKDGRKGRQTVFFTALGPVHEHPTKEQQHDVIQP